MILTSAARRSELPSGVELIRDESAEWDAHERSLAAAGVRLALPHRAVWKLARKGVESLRVLLRGPDGSCAGAFVIQAGLSRAVPGFRVLRVERFGEALPRGLWAAAVDALMEVAHRERRVLRLTVEVFSRDREARSGLGELLAAAGFVRAPTARNWSTTLVLDLQPSETELFASFSASARRGIRSVQQHPLQVRVVDDCRLGDRLEALSRETRARTGGRYQALWDWAGVIELSRRVPDAARLVGMFRTDREGPDALLGFSWGWWNGQSVSYFAGASSRPTDLGRVHIGYPLMWDLIVWAKQTGAAWFDLGGVTAGTASSGDPLGGISDFKRLFAKQTAEVADDWVLEPRKFVARLAGLVSTGAAWASWLASRSAGP
jgi:Acetyltransferase (GNAT) domain